MLLGADDFREVFGAGGERFERLMHDLVRTEARRLGIPPNDVHWDQRTNVPDGGCDIWVARGHGDGTSFLPVSPTSISLKSGVDGTTVGVFAREVREHPRLIQRLRDGGSFLWCCPRPVDQERRNEFVAEAATLANEVGCNAELFKFFWIDAIADRVEQSPHLISEHLPNVWRRLEGLTLVKNWRPDDREPVRQEPKWVGFGARDSVKLTVKAHLLGSTANRLLHIAGLSGSGKTRTVIEACRDEESLAEVIYAPKLSDAVDRLLTHLDAVKGSALLVIDELPLEEYDALARRIGRSAGAVRVITIGPARANEAQREGILILAPPETANDVAEVARAGTSVLADDVIKSIADFAGQDLRLALLLVEATLKVPDARIVPLRDNSDVWTRIRRLFDRVIICPNFDHCYGLLTSTIDVGVAGKWREELAHVARHFGEEVGALEACIRDAIRAGLGFMPFDHFEASPRSLAQWMFLDRVWPILRLRIEDFLRTCPDRLRKKFLERCQELPEVGREEVMATVRDFFLMHFGEPRLSRLKEDNASKIFQTWAETDPDAGLRWLSRAASAASLKDLADFDGKNDYTAGWNGRRQIVWLCEHLACFGESFSRSEEILFRLSHVETEKAIANNGTAIWTALFHPWASYTEVPFDDRLALLMNRLEGSTGRSLELVVDAAISILGDGGMRAIPPAVVGGRVRPTEWKPKTRGELLDCMQTGGRRFIATTSTLPKARQLLVLDRVIPSIGRFFDVGLFDEVRTWIGALAVGEQHARNLRKAVDDWLSWRNSHSAGNELITARVEAVSAWRNAFAPISLMDRVKELTGRAYWDHLRFTRRARKGDALVENERAIERDYRSLARELLADPRQLAEARSWFESPDDKSGDALARVLAQIDVEGKTHHVVARWIEDGTALSFCAGYLRGLAAVHKRAPSIDAALDSLANALPGVALRLTTSGDITEIGFDRLMRCLGTIGGDDLWALRPLATYDWRDVLDERRLLALVRELRRFQQNEATRAVASDVGIGILSLIYSEKPVDQPEVAVEVLRILTDAAETADRNSWEWTQLAKAVQSHSPKAVCRLAVDHLVKSRTGLDDSLNEFVVECARAEPDEVMSAIGDVLADKKQRWMFRSLVFREMFDAIGVPAVSRYLDAHPDHAVFIARHVAGPSMDQSGTMLIPPLADWIMSRFGDDEDVWAEFMMGRHSLEVMAVPRGYEAAREAATHFIRHEKAWVRKWATDEIADMDRQLAVHRREEDRRERE